MNISHTRKAINPAYRKHKPLRGEIDNFIIHLKECIDTISYSDQKNESEEHIKEPIRKFLQATFYQEHLINTKDRIDLAIYLGKNAKSDIGVLIEAKRPSNKAEFLTPDSINKKALHELLLYYLKERVDNKNNNIKHLIATNGYEWFLFKGEDFYNLFYKNNSLTKEYESFRDGLKDSSKNELFYNEIARKYIAEVESTLPFVYLNFQKTDFSKVSDHHLNTFYKIFSDVHILGKSFGNDSNQLNKTFYNELLHIIGLEELSDKGKKIIYRKSEKDREYASILENTIFTLENRDYLSNAKGFTNDNDKAFNVGLELSLTWVNRVLFLKLLESQLLSYHKNAKEYKFLNSEFINGFDDLNNMFFSALAIQPQDRHPRYKDKFKHIPYLNSSLFDRSTLEQQTFEVSALKDDELEVYSSTVLKDSTGKKLKGKLTTLDYLFKFLNAYNFATDGTEGIEDAQEHKTLINASVLGLIFEKINGYKEGSFYTPAYITMYMCKETIRRAVVEKFKEKENNDIESFDDLKTYCHRFFKKEDIIRFNVIINDLKICDPAVGSGHFLVSALNEFIAIKNELGILTDENGLSLRCEIQVENDELFITNSDGFLFEYIPTDKESARIQKTLFHEKQTIIENCLFGVDINPNSVQICRLRLWIELLKNAYYTPDNELQTLPNIDINIKTGDSLISRFKLEDDLKFAFKGKEVKYTFKDYRNAVAQYKNTNSKEQKRELLEIIKEVKNNFTSTLSNKFIEKFQKAQGAYINEEERLNNLKLFGEKIKKEENDNLKKLKLKATKALQEKDEITNNAIYQNAFEWRFEFPEVLDNEGNYIGFDVIIGNPPYIQLQKDGGKLAKQYEAFGFETFQRTGDIYSLFYEKGYEVLKPKGHLIFITSNKWMRAGYGTSTRRFLTEKTNPILLIDFTGHKVFDSATVDTNILLFSKEENKQNTLACIVKEMVLNNLSVFVRQNGSYSKFKSDESWIVLSSMEKQIRAKIERIGTPLRKWDISINYGIKTGFNEAFIIDGNKRKELIEKDPKSEEIIQPVLRGRDIKRYSHVFADLYLLFIPWHFPLHKDPNITGASLKAEQLFEDQYPAVFHHLSKFKKELSNRNRAETGIRYEWYALQRWGANYWEDFSKQKIIFQEMVQESSFILDTEGKFMCLDTARIITGKDLEVLVCVLNSNLFFYSVKTFYGGGALGENGVRMKHTFFESFPMPSFTEEQRTILKRLLEDPTNDNINRVDQIIYQSFNLDRNEIEIIESQ